MLEFSEDAKWQDADVVFAEQQRLEHSQHPDGEQVRGCQLHPLKTQDLQVELEPLDRVQSEVELGPRRTLVWPELKRIYGVRAVKCNYSEDATWGGDVPEDL